MKMKKLQIIKSISVIAIIMAFVACSKDDDSSNSTTDDGTSAQQTTQVAQEGKWRVTYFFDTDQDETNNFTGWEFQFNTNGTLVATNGSQTKNGTWSVVDDSSNSSSDDDGNSTDDDDFNIFFSVSQDDDFEDLNDDWDIISVSSSKIELIDISGGNGGTDYLTFEKV